MSELNHDILEKNISQLLKRKGITQNQLAEIAGMTQANVSKALNPKEKKHFTIDQIYRISRYFKVSIDSLVGDSEEIKASPRSCFEFLSYLMKIGRLRTTTIEYDETVYEKDEIWTNFLKAKRTISTPAFYFPDFYTPTTDKDNAYAENIYFEKKSNKTDYYQLNRVLEKTSPIIRLFFNEEIPEDALDAIIEKYMEGLSETITDLNEEIGNIPESDIPF